VTRRVCHSACEYSRVLTGLGPQFRSLGNPWDALDLKVRGERLVSLLFNRQRESRMMATPHLLCAFKMSKRCQPRHLLEVGIKGHRVAVARHKRNLQRLARALDRRVRLGELGRKATARRELMCAEVLTHDLLVRERRHRRRRAALCEQLQVGGSSSSGAGPWVLAGGSWWESLAGAVRGLLFYSFPARRSLYMCSRTAVLCACLRRCAPVCALDAHEART
jgi:hypothetical protein